MPLIRPYMGGRVYKAVGFKIKKTREPDPTELDIIQESIKMLKYITNDYRSSLR